MSAALEKVIEAAERHARELLGQASNYEKLATEQERRTGTGQQQIANETYGEHYRPLRDAIDTLRQDCAHRALWFTPDAIREHFEAGDDEIARLVKEADDEQLQAVGEDALQADVFYREFHDELRRSAEEILNREPTENEKYPEQQHVHPADELPMPGDRY